VVNLTIIVTLYFIENASHSSIKIKKGNEELKLRNKSSNIEDFISYIQAKEPSICGSVCPGSPYKDIFAGEPRKRSPYEEASDSEGEGAASAEDWGPIELPSETEIWI